jgi:Caenorhabditis protein of unknown function, DUF268/Protein of unknown function (DUF616)
MNPTSPRLVIYTVLTGSKEPLGDPLSELLPGGEQTDLEVDWVCFSDDVQAVQAGHPRWQMRWLDEPLPPERSSRRPKCLPHEYLSQWQVSLYIDNIVRFSRLPSRQELGLAQWDGQAPLLRAFEHATRSDPSTEAEAIVQLGYERVERLAQQLDDYRQRGLLEKISKLSTCTLLLRHHLHPVMQRMGRLWWEQFLLYGKRDQMSFDLAVQQSGASMDYWPNRKSSCDWLVNTGNISRDRVLASFDAARYRWLYRDDPEAQAEPRKHYLRVGRHDGRNHNRPAELLEWLCYQQRCSLGSQVAPRRRLAEVLEPWLLPRRQLGARMLMVAVEGGNEPAAFSAVELATASQVLGTYMSPHDGLRMNLAAADLSAGNAAIDTAQGQFDLLVLLGAAGHELPQVLSLLRLSLAPAAGLLLVLTRSPAEADAIAHMQQQLQAQFGAGTVVQTAVQGSHHDSLDLPLRNSLLAFAWAPLRGPAGTPPAVSTSGSLPAPMSQAPKRYIAYCTSGLGNRLRPLASALAYCKATGRKLQVYWDDVTPNGCLTPWSDLFTTAIEPIGLAELAALDPSTTALFTEKGPGHGVEREATRHERPQLLTLAKAGARLNPSQALRLDEAADTIVVYDNDYLQCLPRQTSIEALRSLNPHPAIRARVMATAAGLALKPDTPAVHARGTDFNLQQALATYAALIDERIPNGAFFLSTEDAELETGLRARYGERIKSRTDRLHLQLNEGKTSWSEPDSYTITRAHGVDALVDIYLLASVTLSVYHPGSTFAEIARHLHGLMQGLPAPLDPWPQEAPSALAQAKVRFAQQVQAIMPRGGTAYPLEADTGPAGPLPPEQLPPAFFYWETLGYRLPLMERLFMNSYSGQPRLQWDGDLFNQLAAIPYANFPLDIFKRLCPYPEAWSQMAAMRGYISGRKILVIGSETYWIELLCALAGAGEITTVEYRPIEWTKAEPKAPVRTITWDAFIDDLAVHEHRYDLVLSYSSIEHSGLGRYGDRLTPLGDLFTFQLMTQCMKPNGLCAAAVPTGQDLTHFNAHRIYGVQRIRAMEHVSGLRYQGIVFPDAAYLADDPVESLRSGWTLPALAGLPLGQYRQPILCFAQEGFSPATYGR